MATDFCTGFGEQIASTAGGYWSLVLGGVSFSTTNPRPGGDGVCAVMNFSSGGCLDRPLSASSSQVAIRAAFRPDHTSTTALNIATVAFHNGTDLAEFKQVWDGFDVTGWQFVCGAQSFSGTYAMTVGSWYVVDIVIDSSTSPWTVKVRIKPEASSTWDVDVTDNTSITSTRTWTTARLGANFAPGFAYQFAMDDVLVARATTTQLGDGKGILLQPSAVDSHNLDASPSAFFFKHDNTTETALTSSETTSYQMIDESPTATATPDRVLVKASTSSGSGSAISGATTATSVSGTWTSITNMQGAQNGTYATVSPAKNGTAAADLSFDFTGVGGVPSGATITSITVVVRVKDSTAGANYTFDTQVNDNGTLGAAQTNQPTTADADYSMTFGSLSAAVATLKVRVTAKRGNTNTASTFSFDDVRISAISYTVPSQPAATYYVGYAIGDTSETAAPNHVGVINALRNDAGTTANSITAKVSDDSFTHSVDVYSGIDIGSASLIFKDKQLATKPSDSGAWTISALNALKFRWGYTADADSTPRLEAVFVVADIPIAGASIVNFTGSIGGGATVSAAVVRQRAITAAINGSSAVSAGVVRTRALSGTISGAASLSAAVVRTRVLAGSIAGSSALSATVTVSSGATQFLSGSISGSAAISGAVVRTRPVAGSILGAAALSAAVVRDRRLQPAINGVSTVSAAVVRARALAAAVAGASSISVGLVRTRALSGAVGGVSTISGAVVIDGAPVAAQDDQSPHGWIHYYT